MLLLLLSYFGQSTKQQFICAGLTEDTSAHAVCRQRQQQHLDVTVQDVHFGYTGEREVVGGVSLSVEPGQSIALVGPSGSGKSTILKLLMRLYDVNSGSILLDGIDTRDLQQVNLRPSCKHLLVHASQVTCLLSS